MLRDLVRRSPALYRFAQTVRRKRIHSPEHKVPFHILGGDPENDFYGAWAVPHGVLGSDSVAYSFGVGEDITFDLALIDQFGCEVFAFDPSPPAKAYLEKSETPPEFHFFPIGVSAVDGEAEFYPPEGKDPSYQKRGSAQPIKFPVRRLSTLLAENGHTHLDLLKMDIEGFEYEVLDDLLVTGIRPQVLLVEFHHRPFPKPEHNRNLTQKSAAALRDAGYRLFWVSDLGSEYGFML